MNKTRDSEFSRFIHHSFAIADSGQSVKEPSAVCVGVAGFSDQFKNSLFPFQNYYIA